MRVNKASFGYQVCLRPRNWEPVFGPRALGLNPKAPRSPVFFIFYFLLAHLLVIPFAYFFFVFLIFFYSILAFSHTFSREHIYRYTQSLTRIILYSLSISQLIIVNYLLLKLIKKIKKKIKVQ